MIFEAELPLSWFRATIFMSSKSWPWKALRTRCTCQNVFSKACAKHSWLRIHGKVALFLKKSSLLLPVSCAAVALLSFLLYYSVPAPLISSYSGSAELPVSEKNACNSIQMLTIFHRLLCLAVSFCSFPAVAVARSGSCVPVPAPHWGKILPAPLY